MTPHQQQGGHPEWDRLPDTIKTYLIAHADRDGAAAITAFATDAVVTDEGRDHIGRDEIRAWLDDSAGEYTYTTEFVSATTAESGIVDVLQHLEGDFPGGAADLHFRFTLDGELINRLLIEP